MMLVDFFDKTYASIKDKNALLSKLRFYSALRFGVRSLANAVLPVYFRWTRHNPAYRLSEVDKSNGRLIVSLTSFPARIGRVWLVVETLLRQTKKPDMIILWLSAEQFPTKDILPRKLLNLQERGLRIELRHGDLRSHKKYYYALTEYPDDMLVTADDDILYKSTMLESLINTSEEWPGCVIANYVHGMTWKEGRLCSYNDWVPTVDYGYNSDTLFFGSGGGTLFTPQILPQAALRKDVFMLICRNADDVWLNVMARLNGKRIVKSSYVSSLLPVQNWHNKTLSSDNLASGNDIQIEAVRKYCMEHFGKDPFACRG